MKDDANFIKATLKYSLSADRLFCLIGNNFSTTKATAANRLGVPLMGCQSHRFNLSVEQYLHNFPFRIFYIRTTVRRPFLEKAARKLSASHHGG